MVPVNVEPGDGPAERVELVDPFVVVCGFTGRNAAQVAAHVAELGKLGIAAPSSTPVFIPVPGSLLSQTDNGSVAVSSRTTSGEAEPVLIRVPGRGDLFSVGSDHTDRALEAESIAAGKEACPKFISSVAWPFDEISDRWDRLELTAMVNGATEPVLASTLAAITHPSDLISVLEASLTLPDDRPSVLFLGTVPVAEAHAELGGVSRFAAQLRDPDTDRTLVCAYDIREPAEDADEASGGTEAPQ